MNKVQTRAVADAELNSRFDTLASLEDGWLDGVGAAPDAYALETVRAMLVGQYPEFLPLPFIFPTPEGDLLFEWELPGSPSVDLYLSDLTADFHVFGSNKENIYRPLRLATAAEWHELWKWLGYAPRAVAA